MTILQGISIVVILLFLIPIFSCFIISGRCSREEEQREYHEALNNKS